MIEELTIINEQPVVASFLGQQAAALYSDRGEKENWYHLLLKIEQAVHRPTNAILRVTMAKNNGRGDGVAARCVNVRAPPTNTRAHTHRQDTGRHNKDQKDLSLRRGGVCE